MRNPTPVPLISTYTPMAIVPGNGEAVGVGTEGGVNVGNKRTGVAVPAGKMVITANAEGESAGVDGGSRGTESRNAASSPTARTQALSPITR